MLTVATQLEKSHDYCRELARRCGRNFYYAFLPLSRDKFQAMCALYAFMRLTDDLGDNPLESEAVRRQRLKAWRDDVAALEQGHILDHPIWPALRDTIERFQIPPRLLLDVITGVERDLGPVAISTFAELQDYCYHVAGAVGLCCLKIWELQTPEAEKLAIDCGLAFQLTNILRDLKEDAALGRIYLPAEDLQRFEYSPAQLLQGERTEAFTHLMEFEVARARGYYQSAANLLPLMSRETRPVLGIMLRIYSRLLDEIELRRFDVFSRRIRVSRWLKLWSVASEVLRSRWASGPESPPRSPVRLP